MNTIRHGDATIQYTVNGEGPPVLALAPGGLRASRAATWEHAPINPLTELADRFRVVGMDQRNTGTSSAPITASTDWSDYTADQLAVMDSLGIDRFSVIGMCIGGSFIMNLIATAPERIAAAVALQPIGLDDNLPAFREVFDDWRSTMEPDHPETDPASWEPCWANLFGTGHTLFSVPDTMLPDVETPILVCEGSDEHHPASASRHLARTIRHGELLTDWKHGPDREAAIERIRGFLIDHA